MPHRHPSHYEWKAEPVKLPKPSANQTPRFTSLPPRLNIPQTFTQVISSQGLGGGSVSRLPFLTLISSMALGSQITITAYPRKLIKYLKHSQYHICHLDQLISTFRMITREPVWRLVQSFYGV